MLLVKWTFSSEFKLRRLFTWTKLKVERNIRDDVVWSTIDIKPKSQNDKITILV